ncbi:hypothetical protein ACQY0O_003769 [Thecaphora frezii]
MPFRLKGLQSRPTTEPRTDSTVTPPFQPSVAYVTPRSAGVQQLQLPALVVNTGNSCSANAISNERRPRTEPSRKPPPPQPHKEAASSNTLKVATSTSSFSTSSLSSLSSSSAPPTPNRQRGSSLLGRKQEPVPPLMVGGAVLAKPAMGLSRGRSSSIAIPSKPKSNNTPKSLTNFRPITYQTQAQVDSFFGTTPAQERGLHLRHRDENGRLWYNREERDEWRHLLSPSSPLSPDGSIPRSIVAQRRRSSALSSALPSANSESSLTPTMSAFGLVQDEAASPRDPVSSRATAAEQRARQEPASAATADAEEAPPRRNRLKRRSSATALAKLVQDRLPLQLEQDEGRRWISDSPFKRRASMGETSVEEAPYQASREAAQPTIHIGRLPLERRKATKELLDEAFSPATPPFSKKETPKATALQGSVQGGRLGERMGDDASKPSGTKALPRPARLALNASMQPAQPATATNVTRTKSTTVEKTTEKATPAPAAAVPPAPAPAPASPAVTTKTVGQTSGEESSQDTKSRIPSPLHVSLPPPFRRSIPTTEVLSPLSSVASPTSTSPSFFEDDECQPPKPRTRKRRNTFGAVVETDDHHDDRLEAETEIEVLAELARPHDASSNVGRSSTTLSLPSSRCRLTGEPKRFLTSFSLTTANSPRHHGDDHSHHHDSEVEHESDSEHMAQPAHIRTSSIDAHRSHNLFLTTIGGPTSVDVPPPPHLKPPPPPFSAVRSAESNSSLSSTFSLGSHQGQVNATSLIPRQLHRRQAHLFSTPPTVVAMPTLTAPPMTPPKPTALPMLPEHPTAMMVEKDATSHPSSPLLPSTPPYQQQQQNQLKRYTTSTGLRTGIQVYDGVDIPCPAVHLGSDAEEDSSTPSLAASNNTDDDSAKRSGLRGKQAVKKWFAKVKK